MPQLSDILHILFIWWWEKCELLITLSDACYTISECIISKRSSVIGFLEFRLQIRACLGCWCSFISPPGMEGFQFWAVKWRANNCALICRQQTMYVLWCYDSMHVTYICANTWCKQWFVWLLVGEIVAVCCAGCEWSKGFNWPPRVASCFNNTSRHFDSCC